MEKPNYRRIVEHYESCLSKHGDTHLGVDWPNPEDAQTRYRVMLDVVKPQAQGQVTLLDFGCGTAHLYDYIRQQGRHNIGYSGLDLSQRFVEASRAKHPAVQFYCLDILRDAQKLPMFDYVVMNGVFTEKCSLSFDEMWDYFRRTVEKVFAKARIAIAFNVMSKLVDWERDDLFHLPFDMLAQFVTANLSRNFVIRNDYGLYEYTTYVYR